MSTESDETNGQEALRQLPPDDEALAALNQQDPARYRRLHEQALHALNAQLAVGDPTVEPAWTAVFERLANLFYARDTAALLQLTADAQALRLHTPPAQHIRQFVQGMAYFRQAQYAAALAAFADLLTRPDLDTYLRARTLNSRAVVCRVTGRLEEAMAGYSASLSLWQTLGNDHYQGIVNLNLGIISYTLRRYAEAERYLHQAERFFQAADSSDWLAKTQSELGLVQRDLGNWEQSLAYLDAYIARSEQQEAWEDVGVGEINRGEVLLFKGAVVEAKTALTRALQLTVSQTYRIDPLLFLGLAYQADGDLVQAEAHYQQALALALAIERREILPHVYFYLGDVVRLQGKNADAMAYWRQAAVVIEETHTPLRDASLKISLLGRWQQVYEALILHCAALGQTSEAFAWAERARARAFAEGLAEGERPFPTTIVSLPELQAAIPADTTLFCYFTTGVLEQDVPLLRAIPHSSPLRAHILTPAKTLLFVIGQTEIQLHECPLDPNLFATHSPRGFEARRFLKTAVLQRLHATLLKPFTATHLVVIPHGPLHRVPFTALFADQENRPTLSFAPSGAIFARQQEKRRQEDAFQDACLAVGYNAQNLNYAAAEAAMVAQAMAGEVWVSDEPKKDRLRQRAAACRWLHIACHGWFDDTDPLASYLETGADERLTAREVLETWTLPAELVTLSACETGISQILRGDEPMGLVRAFLVAGARAVLVSQWPVDDLATFLLMTRFYQEIGASPGNLSLALNRAQKWLREATAVTIQQIVRSHDLPLPPSDWLPDSTPFAAPEYWAGFILVGNL
ncbi:MAG: CHAT domain-containing tetratricopeptide repeat protein [Chloroflexota bacterium]